MREAVLVFPQKVLEIGCLLDKTTTKIIVTIFSSVATNYFEAFIEY